jgi:hypothetical protein
MTSYHVAITGNDQNSGSADAPFRTINAAASRAVAGDTVVVHAGEYREWVKPRNGGLSNVRRITYTAAEGEKVVIKGSERVQSWVAEGNGVWRAEVGNELFGDWNPYAIPIWGDWMVYKERDQPKMHLGDVYLNGVSFYEATSRAALDNPPARTHLNDEWTGKPVAIDPIRSQRLWYAEAGWDTTVIWANFGDADPNAELTEINVRRSVFYPEANHLDYITVRGFELAHAACPYTPPTADQPGLIGPNWAKGWIIEDNVIHDAKCSAVSLGKEASTGDNWFSKRLDKPGYQYQLEAVFSARHIGWSKEHIGSHIVRRNTIYSCGQNGIVGHLGCVFSEIYDNHIYDIQSKHEWYGYEVGGIKLHAASDVQIRHNRIHDCSLGTWLDWQAQGTRVSRNIYYRNNRDLFVEVSHGPYVADHNIFASPVAIELMSQGGAYVNNLIGGTLRLEKVMDRATPYHEPHSTQVAGFAVVYGADDRFIGNLFCGAGVGAAPFEHGYTTDGLIPASNVEFGTCGYRGNPASFQEYLQTVEAAFPGDDLEAVINLKQPAYLRNNVYLNGARPGERETDPVVADADPKLQVVDTADEVFLEIDLPAQAATARVSIVSTPDLGRVRFVDADYEAPDGSILVLDTDLLGAKATQPTAVGPVASLQAGPNKIKVW